MASRATYTTNLNLVKPDVDDSYDITLSNDNMDKVDKAIGELKTNLGNKETLTTSKKDSLVDAINELDKEVGDITTLKTDKKDNLVNAVNEVKVKTDSNKSELDKIKNNVGENFEKIKPVYAEITLEFSKWSGQTYSLEDKYPSANYDIELELSGNATKEMVKSWTKAMPLPDSEGLNKIKLLGDKPEINILLRVKAVAK